MKGKNLVLFILALSCISTGSLSTFSQTNQALSQIVVVTASPPKYPPLARITNTKGSVLVAVDVDAQGSVASAKAIEGHPLLRQSAEAAAMLWKFAPASDRDPLRSTRLTFVFDMKYEEETSVRDEIAFLPPYTLEFTYKIPTIAALPRIDERLPEETCRLHGERMKLDVVPILYGLPRATITYRTVDVISFLQNIKRTLTKRESYSEASARLFPSSNMIGYGGCMVSYEIKTEVLYCAKCRAIEAEWRRQHPKRGPEAVAVISGGKP
jgi:TonB family protein